MHALQLGKRNNSPRSPPIERRGIASAKTVRMYNINPGKLANIINVKTNLKSPTSFLIDTGADISVIKQGILSEYIRIRNNTCKITGITTEEINSLGEITAELHIEDKTLRQKFQVVEDNFPIIADGILGRDFLADNKCRLDFELFTLTIRADFEDITIPLETKIPKYTSIILKARTQTIHPINCTVKEDSLVLSDEIEEGIFVANTLVPAKGVAHIQILNTKNQDIEIKIPKLKILPLREYHVVKSHKTGVNKEQRFEQLKKELNLNNTDEVAKETLLEIIKEYSDIFYLTGDRLGVNNFYKQHIEVNDRTPVYIKNYRLPQTQKQEIDKQIEKLLEEDIIEPSISPYNSPLLVIPKKSNGTDKKWRMVVDFRQLNKKIVDDKFPLTRLEDILDNLGRARYFSTLDLTSSFHQIELEPHAKPLTAFSTDKGHFQFKRLPFGLKISTNSFQRMLSVALSGLDAQTFLYVDDIIIFGSGLKHHNQNLKKTFDRLRKYNLKLNPQKCNFLQTEVVYLGHLITSEGIKTDPSKYEAISRYPVPKSAEEIKRFVAFCNYYRRFIPNFAAIARPMNELCRKGAMFNWSEECQKSFQTLKEKLMNPPILQYPDFEQNFVLTTDASNYALGAVLSQGEIGTDRPISYASRTLTKHEIRKPVIEKELLGIYWAIQHFRPYLYGRRFTVVTDHRPLVSLFTHKNPSSKMTRIRLELSDYDFDIKFKKGLLNTNADALSRIELDSDALKTMIPTEVEAQINVVTTRSMNRTKQRENSSTEQRVAQPTNVTTGHPYIRECTSISEIRKVNPLIFRKVHQKKNNEIIRIIMNKDEICVEYSDNPRLSLRAILEKLILRMKDKGITKLALSKEDGIFQDKAKEEIKIIYEKLQQELNTGLLILLYDPPKRIEDKEEMLKIIELFHNAPHAGGHSGVKRTINKIKQRYIWKNLNTMVKKFVSKCEKCAINKQVRHTKEQLVLTDTPNSSFETVEIDTVGPLINSNGYRYILTVQCELTKFVQAYPMENKEASTVARILAERFLLQFGICNNLKSDKGTEFVNEVITKLCEIFHINHIKSTPYHHETLGTIERNHRVLNEYLLSFADKTDWEQWLPYYTFCYNITPHTDTNFSPYELVFGKIANIPTNITKSNKKVHYNLDNYAIELKVRLQQAHETAKALIESVKINRKIMRDKSANPIEIQVNDLVLLRVGNKRKHEAPYKGPYKVVDINGVNVKLQIDNNIKEVHKNRIKQYVNMNRIE